MEEVGRRQEIQYVQIFANQLNTMAEILTTFFCLKYTPTGKRSPLCV